MSSGGPGEAHLAITLSDEQDLKVDTGRLVHVARRTAASEGASGEISMTLVSEERMRELNEAYLGELHSTDVLAFPIDDDLFEGSHDTARRGSPDFPPRMIGEVVICPEVAARQAEDGVPSELDLLVAHGVLHLLGYDHDTEDHAARMRLREHDLTGRSGARA